MLVVEPLFQARPAECVQTVQDRQWRVEDLGADGADELPFKAKQASSRRDTGAGAGGDVVGARHRRSALARASARGEAVESHRAGRGMGGCRLVVILNLVIQGSIYISEPGSPHAQACSVYVAAASARLLPTG